MTEESLPESETPYPGMPEYVGNYLDAYLGRPWGWSNPVVQNRYLHENGIKKEDLPLSSIQQGTEK